MKKPRFMTWLLDRLGLSKPLAGDLAEEYERRGRRRNWDPTRNVNAHYWAGMVLSGMRRNEEAVPFLEEAVETKLSVEVLIEVVPAAQNSLKRDETE